LNDDKFIHCWPVDLSWQRRCLHLVAHRNKPVAELVYRIRLCVGVAMTNLSYKRTTDVYLSAAERRRRGIVIPSKRERKKIYRLRRLMKQGKIK